MSETNNNYEFKAEVSKILNILTHSLYTNREIFLRELISNASDALDKLRFIQSSSEADKIIKPELNLSINLRIDKDKKILEIADTGIGMTKEELIDNLGIIAKSGSEKFMEEWADKQDQNKSLDAASIIGKFGIGFYSVFMVADKIEVLSRYALDDTPAHIWTSSGSGSFSVATLSPAEAEENKLERGTIIRIYVKDDASEFLEKFRLESIIKTHSSFIPFPIFVEGEHLNTTSALWREPKFSISEEQYAEFYKFLTYSQKNPLETLHLSVDVPVQFTSLLFIPDEADEYFGPYHREHWGLELYVKRILIQKENKEVIPEYLSFLKGVVDTEDLPLNISRETLQENLVLRKINQTLVKQTLNHLEKLSRENPEKYTKFWNLHGKIFKLGYTDFVNLEKVCSLFRFNSCHFDNSNDLTSLDDYIQRAKTDQKDIWYLAAPNREAAELNPQLEVFKRKGLEVLYLFEPIDEFALESINKYKEFNFKAIELIDDSTLENFSDNTDSPKVNPLSSEDSQTFDQLLGTFKEILKEQVKEVKLSHRLDDSPACLVSVDGRTTSSMEKLLRVMQKDDSIPQKTLELNQNHPLLRTMLKIYKADKQDPYLAEMIQNLFDNTLLLDGYLKDPHTLAGKNNKLLEQACSWYTGVKNIA